MSGNAYTASGFGDNSLASIFSQEIVVPQIINQSCAPYASWKPLIGSDYMGDLNDGDQIKFYKFGGSFEVTNKEYNGTERFQTADAPESICAQLCAPRQIQIKRNTCMLSGHAKAMADKTYGMQLENTFKKEGISAVRRVMMMKMNGAHAKNKGLAAGAITGNINLGTQTTPLKIDVSRGTNVTATSIRRDFVDVFYALQQAKLQQNDAGCNSSCDWTFKLPQMVIDAFVHIENSENCCDWNQSLMLNGGKMFKSFLGSPLYAFEGNTMPIIPTPTGFKAPIVFSCPEAGYYTHGVSCATIDNYHDDETIKISLKEGGIITQPELVSVAWVEVITK